MRKLLSIWMLACLLCGMVLPAAAEESECTLTAGCTRENGHDGECFVPCKVTQGCTENNGHTDLCDALCDNTEGCLLLDGHTEPCVTELVLGEDAAINVVLASKDALVDYLEEKYPGYCYAGGDITLKLLAPTDGYGAVEVKAELDDGSLTLRGASGTKMTGLTISAENVSVDGITFCANPGITVNTPAACTVSNCVFPEKAYAFRLRQDASGNAPMLKLAGNTFEGAGMAILVDSAGTTIGKWLAATASKPETAQINFGTVVEKDAQDGMVKAIHMIPRGEKETLIKNGWKFNFATYCDDTSCYLVYDGKKADDTYQLDKPEKGWVQYFVSKDGRYTVVSGTYPTAVDGKVKITDEDAKYLREVTVQSDTFKGYSGVSVTVGSTKVPAAVNGNQVTFTLNGAGTYIISEDKATTTTTTTKTTSRSYKYTYQDYYRVTPAGFSNAMRYVKDNLVTIDCTQAGRKSISLPVESMTAAAEKGYSVLLKNEKIADITIDAAALKSMAQQAKGTTVLLHYKSLNHKTLTTVGQASIQSHLSQFPGDSADLAFLVTATSDSETIEDLQKGTITLKIPFIVLPGTEGAENTVYALQSESVAEARETAVSDGFLTTKLLDLTEHMVFQAGEPAQTTAETTVETTQPETEPETEPVTEATQPPQPEKAEKNGGGLLGVLVMILGILLAMACGVLGVVFLRGRKKQELD